MFSGINKSGIGMGPNYTNMNIYQRSGYSEADPEENRILLKRVHPSQLKEIWISVKIYKIANIENVNVY